MREHYQLVIQRIDEYTSGINTKGTLIVAFNTFLFGSVITQHEEFLAMAKACSCTKTVYILFVLLCTAELLSTFFVGLAVFPYMKSGNSDADGYRSHMFFKSIAEFSSDEAYHASCAQQTEEQTLIDLQKQIYVLSKGLTDKHHWIGYAMWCFFSTLLIITAIAVVITL